MRKGFAWAAAAAMVGLSACTGTTDPSRAGFFDGMRNLADGTYAAQAAEQDRKLADLTAIREDLRRDTAARQTLLRDQAAEIAAAQGRVRAMNRDLTQVERRLAALRARGQVSQRLLEAERQAAALRRRQAALSRQQTPASAEEQAVRREMNALVDAVSQLNRPE